MLGLLNGGLDLGLQSVVGGTVAWHAEYDPASAAILAHHWPHVPNLRDITTVDWSTVEPVDWLTAGYPCQPFSLAGKRKGADDERHLWPAVAAAVGALRPRWVFLENVAGHVTLGLDVVVGDLAALRYDAVWCLVRADETGACHRRERVFILAADPDSDGLQSVGRVDGHERDPDRRGRTDVTWGPYEPAIHRWERALGRPAPRPTEPGRHGKPRLGAVFVEWLMGLPAGHVTAVPGLTRADQLRALGNGVVPQQAALAVRLLLDLHHESAHHQPERP